MKHTLQTRPGLRRLSWPVALLSALASGQVLADGPPGPREAPGMQIYGVLDAAVEHLRDSNGQNVTLLQKVGHVPSRLGFKGIEDLGGGMRARMNLEMGIGVDTGESVNSKAFAREANVSLSQSGVGELRLGLQQSLMEEYYLMFDNDHLSQYSPALAMRLSNLAQDPWENAIAYRSPRWGGLAVNLALSLAERGRVTPGGEPQIVGLGTARNKRAALVSYMAGPWGAGLAYQSSGQSLDAGGSAVQTLWSTSLIYRTQSWELGGMLFSQGNKLPSGTTARTNVWMLGGTWRVQPHISLVAQIGQGRDNSKNYYAGFDKGRGETRYLNLGADYNFSRRSAVYVRVGRISDSGDGFNGRAFLSHLSVAEGLAVPADGSVKGVAIGLRHWF